MIRESVQQAETTVNMKAPKARAIIADSKGGMVFQFHNNGKLEYPTFTGGWGGCQLKNQSSRANPYYGPNESNLHL